LPVDHQNYIRLAQSVLVQWHRDGEPNDFSWINIHDASEGTWKDFWQSIIDTEEPLTSNVHLPFGDAHARMLH